MKFFFTFIQQKEKSPEERKKEKILRIGTRQLKRLFRMGIQFPIRVSA